MLPAKRRLASGEIVDADELEPVRVRPPPAMPNPIAPTKHEARPAAVNSPRTDVEILDAIVSKHEQLTAKERRAFDGMRARMRSRTIFALSYAQRAWAQEVAARLGFDVETPGEWRETAKALRC